MTSTDDEATIITERLELRTLRAEFFEALVAGDRARAEALGGFAVPHGWEQRDRSHALRRLRQLEADPASAPWLTRAVVLRETQTMIGRVGFHEPPGDPDAARWRADADGAGAVEIGYAIFEPYRRHGYASEAAAALIDWAARRRVSHVIASVSPTNAGSLAVIARLGFVRVGERMDERDGLEHVFMREAGTTPPTSTAREP